MHELQTLFASAEGEEAWAEDLRALFGAGALDEAESALEQALSGIDSEFARSCRELPREAVVLTGWEELGEAIAHHEGEPVTGITIAIANEADRAFERGQAHHPFVMLGIYTDEAYRWSKAVHWELLDECQAKPPAWAGHEEDIEVHLDIEGLDQLNTALIHHKQRHFFRDGEQQPAPLRYVEFVLGCWWRALRWQQAVATECAIRGLPGGVPVVSGTVDMRPEAVCVHDAGSGSAKVASRRERKPQPALMAEAFGGDFIQRRAVEDEKEPTGANIRRRIGDAAPEPEPAARSGLLARLLGRG